MQDDERAQQRLLEQAAETGQVPGRETESSFTVLVTVRPRCRRLVLRHELGRVQSQSQKYFRRHCALGELRLQVVQ